MPIDPSIVLGVRQPQIENPLDAFMKMQGARNLIAQTQLHQQQYAMDQEKMRQEQLANKERERASAAQAKLGELLAANTTQDEQGNSTVNHRAIIQGLASAGHGKEAVAYDVQRRADERAAIEDQTKKMANAKTQLGIIGNASQSLAQIGDSDLPAAYDRVRGELIQQGIVTDAQLPPSEAVIANNGIAGLRSLIVQHGQAAIDADKQVDNHLKDLDYAQRLNEFRQKILAEAPKTEKDWLDHAAQLVSAADNQEHLDAALHNLKDAGVPERIINQFDAKFSPEGQMRAAQVGMTAQQRMQAAEAKKTTDYKNYELSKAEGFKGSFEDWQTADANRKKPNESTVGTWQIEEDSKGNPVEHNTKTGEVRPVAGDVQKPGTHAKIEAAKEKEIAPVRGALEYAKNYSAQPPTGPGDEALLEKFFELAKPSTGFRMTKQQIDLLQESRGWLSGAAARVRHAATGTWFSDEQRKQIIGTMHDLAKAKGVTADAAAGGGGGSAMPKKGDKQTHMGANYTFDGAQWVRDK